MRNLSLTTRVAMAVAFLLTVGGVLVAVAAFAYGREAAREAYDRILLGAANDIAASVSVTSEGLMVDLPVSAFQLLASAPDDRIAYQVMDPQGVVLTGYEDLPAPEQLQDSPAFYDADFFFEPARYVVVVRRFAERNLSGSVKVTVGHTLLARNALAFDIASRAITVAAAAGIVMVLLAAFVIRSALLPLERMAEAFANRDPFDLTPIDADVPQEAAGMVRALNAFMGRIDRQVSSMKNLISDTAHQLRTPVAALRAQADLAKDEPDTDRRAAIVDRIHRRTVDLGRLLDQMLSRALVIHRSDSVRREVVDLRDIALEVFESGDHELIKPDAVVRLSIPDDPVNVSADSMSLTEAARNLLNNAVKHGQSPVVIGVDPAGKLWVADAGQGPANTGPVERFATGAAKSGTGLGLSIAASVAEAFGGQLNLVREADGFRVEMAFPKLRGRR